MRAVTLLDWTADKNGLADAELLAHELCDLDWIPSLRQFLDACPELAEAYGRLSLIDANGACCAHTDIREAWIGRDSLEGFLTCCSVIASDLHATCNEITSQE
jgi:hypothetical protein